MAKKVTLETIHKMLSDAKDECDKERFGWISEALCDIIYRIEDWQSI